MTDYDLRRANRRFERYRSIYRDAPKSGVEEFNEATRAPSSDSASNSTLNRCSSSSTIFLNDFGDKLRQAKQNTDLGSRNSSSEVIFEMKMKREKAKTEVTEMTGTTSTAQSHDKTTAITNNIENIKYSNSRQGDSALTTPLRDNINNQTSRSSSVGYYYSRTKAALPAVKVSGEKTGFCDTISPSGGRQHFSKIDQCDKATAANSAIWKSNAATTTGQKRESEESRSAGKLNPKKLLLSEIRDQNPDRDRSARNHLDDILSDWSFSSEEELSNMSYLVEQRQNLIHGHHGRSPGRLVLATATSKAVVDEPGGERNVSLIAAATAEALSSDPYLALARATADAASRVSRVVARASRNNVATTGDDATVSLVVSATIRASSRDLQALANATAASDSDGRALCYALSPMSTLAGRKTPSESKVQRATVESIDAAHASIPFKTRIGSERIYSRQSGPKSESSDYSRYSTVEKSSTHTTGPTHIGSDRLMKLIQPSDKTKDAKGKDDSRSILTERNVQLWSDISQTSNENDQNLLRWKNSMNLTDNEELRKLMEMDKQLANEENAPLASPDNGTLSRDDGVKQLREEYYKSVEKLNEDLKEFRRNRYRSKIDKAKKDYLQSKASASDLYKNSEDFEKKFNVSLDHLRQSEAPRGPYLEYLGKNGSLHSLKTDVMPLYHLPPKSRYDKEYEAIVNRAENLWAHKKRSLTALNRESDNVDDKSGYSPQGQRQRIQSEPGYELDSQSMRETNLDSVFQNALEEDRRCRSQMKNISQVKRKSRGQEKTSDTESHVRARSVDYLVDQEARREIEPPENQLQKILGPPAEPTTTSKLSDHELRFLKSADKLSTPDWYQQSSDAYKKESVRSSPVFSDRRTPEWDKVSADNNKYKLTRIETEKTIHETTTVTSKRTPVVEPSEQSKYGMPWSYNQTHEVALQPGFSVTPKIQIALRRYEDRLNEQINKASYPAPLKATVQPPYKTTPTPDNRRQLPQPQPRIIRPNEPRSVELPRNFFDKYAGEIEELRKSRTNLAQSQEALKQQPANNNGYAHQPIPIATVRPSSFMSNKEQQQNHLQNLIKPTAQKKSVQISEQKPIMYTNGGDLNQSFNSDEYSQTIEENKNRDSRQLGNYTVSELPASWNVPGMRRSVVIEMSDQFLEQDSAGRPAGAHGTLEEIFDNLLNLPVHGQRQIQQLHESNASLNDSIQFYDEDENQLYKQPPHAYGIYTQNNAIMLQCQQNPDDAEELLDGEKLYIRCQYCSKVRRLVESRQKFVSCHYCFTYYCGRSCRKADWDQHKEGRCTFSRISGLCKAVIVKTRFDQEAQYQMSQVAQRGHERKGRGSVNFRFNSPLLARRFVIDGWDGINQSRGAYLAYCTVNELIEARKEINLIKLCRQYDPDRKFVLSVSIIAEIEDVPHTPTAERKYMEEQAKQKSGDQPHRFERSRSVPNNKRKEHRVANKQQQQNLEDTRSLLKSVLRSMENIAPGPVYVSSAERNWRPTTPVQHEAEAAATDAFQRNAAVRSTAIGIERRYRDLAPANRVATGASFLDDSLGETEV